MSNIKPMQRVPPHLSLIMPAYNEEDIIRYTIHHLINAFARMGYNLEIIAVDNGSADRTGEIIKEIAVENPGVVYHRVDVNQGYGNGVLKGIPLCTAAWVGIIPADGQVDAEDVVRLFEAVVSANRPVLGKVRRRFRMDGVRRKIISILYNLLILVLWPQIGTLDMNGSPKLLPREVINRMRLTSKDWFLDPEIMIKAHYMGITVIEFNVFARMRGSGVSHVRMETCWEFLRNLLAFRFSNKMADWRRQLPLPPVNALSDSTSTLVR